MGHLKKRKRGCQRREKNKANVRSRKEVMCLPWFLLLLPGLVLAAFLLCVNSPSVLELPVCLLCHIEIVKMIVYSGDSQNHAVRPSIARG